jgi:hypothetical protein
MHQFVEVDVEVVLASWKRQPTDPMICHHQKHGHSAGVGHRDTRIIQNWAFGLRNAIVSARLLHQPALGAAHGVKNVTPY